MGRTVARADSTAKEGGRSGVLGIETERELFGTCSQLTWAPGAPARRTMSKDTPRTIITIRNSNVRLALASQGGKQMKHAKMVCTFASTLVLSAVASTRAQDRAEPRQLYDGTMRPDVEVKTFAHYEELFPVRKVERGSATRKLPKASTPLKNVYFEAGGKRYDLFDYLALNRVAGLLIVKNGELVLEDYELGTGPETHWPSYSMAKSVSSTLIGAALLDGSIESLDDPVRKYVPALAGGAYEGVSVRNVLQMASGVKWNEAYTDPKSDRRKLLEIQLQEQPGTILPFMSGLPRAGAPGAIWNYNTGETFVVGAVLEGATHKPLAECLSEKIWKPWGMESEAQWQLESPNGMGWAGGGLLATLRDFGRIGLLVQADGVIDGKRVVPKGWFDEAGSAKEIGGETVQYGYLWWTYPKGDEAHEGAFEAHGILGQHLYINRKEKVVIVVLSARPKPTESTVVEDPVFFGAVVKALRGAPEQEAGRRP
jgi:CubicO group peptidase (beta-lactamase class C family)